MVASILTNSHPSLVGLSVRNYETDGHDLSPQNSAKETATQAFLDSQKKIPSTQNILNSKEQEDSYYYTKVSDLEATGCLMDEYDAANINLNPVENHDQEDEHKRLEMLRKQKLRMEKPTAVKFTLSPTHSNSLVSSTDPITDEMITPYNSKATSKSNDDSIGYKEMIKNSLGEDIDIKRKASFPHLARGDSYQTTQNSEDRISRPLIQRAGTSEYLKELNRSKSQDREAIHSDAEGLSHSERNGPYYSIPKDDINAAVGSYTYEPAKRVTSRIQEEDEDIIMAE